MATIIKDGITFNNVQNYMAKGYAGVLTNADNVSSKKYVYDPDSDPVLMALDIDWNGAQLSLPEEFNLGTTIKLLLAECIWRFLLTLETI